jgi:uncharacterized protein (TIGR03546 family)
MISIIAKLIVALNSNSRPSELASGITFGFLLALIPGGNLLWAALFIIAFFLKHNISAFLLSLGIFKLFISIFDPFLDYIGGMLLEYPAFQEFFTKLYNTPYLSYSNFNNTIVTGGFVIGLVLWFPIFFIFIVLIKVYRKKVAPKVAESKFVKTLKKIPIISKLTSSIRKVSVLAS